MNFKFWLALAVSLFAAGFVWGLTLSSGSAGPLTEDLNALANLAEFLATIPQSSVFVFIFLKNAIAVLVGFILAPVLCIMPVAALVLNGGLLGLVSGEVVRAHSIGFLLAGILPHGIIELPALFIGEAAAISFGTAVMASLFSERRRKQIATNFKKNIRYLALAIILLIPAAFIETYITPLLIG